MLWGNPTQKGRYWGIELPPRSAMAQGLDWLGHWLVPVIDVPLLGKIAQLVGKWARDAFLNEQIDRAATDCPHRASIRSCEPVMELGVEISR